jgi:hypothetical protein
MKVNGLLMKRMFVVFVLIVAAVLVLSACRRKSSDDGVPAGGPGPEPPVIIPQVPITFASPQQAAGEVTAALNTKALADTQFAAAMAFGMGSRPAGFAPRMISGDIGRIDPTLKMMVDKMASLSQSPVIQKAIRKAGALKAMRATQVNQTLTVGFCDNADGKIQITGTNNYDDLASTDVISSYTIDFTKCRDDVLLTELNGRINAEETESTAGNAVSTGLTNVDVRESQFKDETFAIELQQSHLFGTFSNSDQITSATMSANGQFSLTTLAQGATPETIVNHSFTGLTNARTTTSDATSKTDVDTINGSFTTGRFIGGAEVFKTTMQITNLVDTVQTITGPVGDAAVGTKNQTINGTIGTAWTPEVAGCLPGLMTITMAAPRTFAAGGTCPVSGAMTINGATITFGSPIQVNYFGASQSFATCTEMDAAGAVCM